MRSQSLILFGALLAFCWSPTASAGQQDSARSAEAPSFLSITNLQLDLALEEFVARSGTGAMRSLAGPSTMDCELSAFLDGIETCVVTATRGTTSVPAALATR